LVEAVWGLMQLYGLESSQHYLFRLTGSFFNPGPYACYIAMVLPVAFYCMLKYDICRKVKFHVRNRFIYFLWSISIITIVVSILILPATMSRISWISAGAGCGLVGLYSVIKNKTLKKIIILHKKKSVILILLGTLLIISCIIGIYQLKKDSADGRLFIWKNTIELIKQKPSGVGIGNFSGSYGDIQAAYFKAEKGSEDEKRVAGNPEYAFNEYLQIFAEQGIIVFLLFFFLLGYSLYIGIKRKIIAPTVSLIALLITASTSYPFSILPFPIILVFLLALINDGEKGIAVPKFISVLFAFCSLIIVLLCLYNRYPTYDAYKKWKNLSILYNLNNQKEITKKYDKIYPFLTDQIQFLFEYAQCLSKSGQYNKSNEILNKAIIISCDPMLHNIMGKNFQAMQLYKKAEECFIKSSHIVPNRIYPNYLLALMYLDAGEIEKAKVAAKIALTKEPKVQSTAIKEMRIQMKNLIDEN
jgi:tetratricopeptide (TPR) repeat protein